VFLVLFEADVVDLVDLGRTHVLCKVGVASELHRPELFVLPAVEVDTADERDVCAHVAVFACTVDAQQNP